MSKNFARWQDLLKKKPESYAQPACRSEQITARRIRGENVSGDKPFIQERFNARMRQIGTARLQAFSLRKKSALMRTVGRVERYMESPPAGSAVNFSNTGSAVANFVNAIRCRHDSLGRRRCSQWRRQHATPGTFEGHGSCRADCSCSHAAIAQRTAQRTAADRQRWRRASTR